MKAGSVHAGSSVAGSFEQADFIVVFFFGWRRQGNPRCQQVGPFDIVGIQISGYIGLEWFYAASIIDVKVVFTNIFIG
jgi:hypothetical protein